MLVFLSPSRGIETPQTIRALPGGTYYEQNAESVELRSPGNPTLLSSFPVSKNTPFMGLQRCNAWAVW
jgi:hypothetical protein